MTDTPKGRSCNLLLEPLIRWEGRDGDVRISTLPDILDTLGAGDEITSFPGLQPHQWPAWHALLVQLSALASLEADEDPRPYTATEWRTRLRGLTAAYPKDDAWCLAVEDLQQPAFLQPPVPEGSLASFDGSYVAPDASPLDVLFTATDHDVKMERQRHAFSDQWIYGLVAFQTVSGYSGKNNYGVIRMNGGYGTRPLVGLSPAREWGALFRRDLRVLLDEHDRLASEHRLPARGGWKLLWNPPWDGVTPIPWADCDPYAIEIARRVRLREESGKLLAYRRATKAPRLAPKSDELRGNVGDPWIPVSDQGAAANITSAGWHYDLIRRILFGDGFSWSPCQQPREDDPVTLWFYAAAMARQQGKTAGFHERWIRVPREIRRKLFDVSGRHELAETARERVNKAGEARKALHRALVVLLASAPEQTPDFRDYSDRRWLDRFEVGVDTVFFDELWGDADKDKEGRRGSWARVLRRIVEREIWPRAESEAPVADARRERAQARAWMMLRGGLKKVIPQAYEPAEEEAHAER